MSLRSPLGKARGLGSAKEGVSHWWWQRVTSVALVPLSVWFVYSLASLAGAGHQTIVDWMQSPIVAALLIMFVITAFYHALLGVQVVVEDYVHTEWLKMLSLITLNFITVMMVLIAVVLVLRVAL